MSELSETYILIRSEVKGKRELDANVVNPLIKDYRGKLESFKIEESKSDGGKCKIWVQLVDEFLGELLGDGRTFLFSYQLKINIYDSLPHSPDNYAHRLQCKLAEGLKRIRIEEDTHSRRIIIENTGIKFAGGGKSPGRWPQVDRAGI